MLRHNVQFLIAKSDRELDERWLPLWVHLLDTAGVMEKLVSVWLPDQSRRALVYNGDAQELGKIARLLGLAHDLGKATPLFQNRIASAFRPDGIDGWSTPGRRLEQVGLHIYKPAIRNNEGENYHTTAGQALLLRADCPEGIAAIVGAHHGVPSDKYSEDVKKLPSNYPYHYYACSNSPENKAEKQLWLDAYSELVEFIGVESGFEFIRAKSGSMKFQDLPELSYAQQVAWSGLLVVADWIASNTYYFPCIAWGELGDYEEHHYRLEDGWNKFAHNDKQMADLLPWVAENVIDAKDLSQKRFNFTANTMQNMAVQAAIDAREPGLFILEAPMGMGKSEAAMMMVEAVAARTGAGGVFWGMPTLATTNAMFSRLLEWLKTAAPCSSVNLVHGQAEFNENFRQLKGQSNCDNDIKENSLYVHPWFSGRKKSLLADFVVGTVDQLLLAALKQRHFMLRHLGLVGKIVVIDECHAYDAYMSQYLNMALTWMGAYGVPVILLSATLPAGKRSDMVKAYIRGRFYRAESSKKQKTIGDDNWDKSEAYPLLTYTDGQYIKQCTNEIVDSKLPIAIERLRWPNDLDQQEGLIGQLVREYRKGCVGIICNTVKRAQKFSEAVRQACPECKIMLNHASFVAADRSLK